MALSQSQGDSISINMIAIMILSGFKTVGIEQISKAHLLMKKAGGYLAIIIGM
jgi:hypothetical protein